MFATPSPIPDHNPMLVPDRDEFEAVAAVTIALCRICRPSPRQQRPATAFRSSIMCRLRSRCASESIVQSAGARPLPGAARTSSRCWATYRPPSAATATKRRPATPTRRRGLTCVRAFARSSENSEDARRCPSVDLPQPTPCRSRLCRPGRPRGPACAASSVLPPPSFCSPTISCPTCLWTSPRHAPPERTRGRSRQPGEPNRRNPPPSAHGPDHKRTLMATGRVFGPEVQSAFFRGDHQLLEAGAEVGRETSGFLMARRLLQDEACAQSGSGHWSPPA